MVGLGGGADALADVPGPVDRDRSMTFIINSLTVIVSLGPFVATVDAVVDGGCAVEFGGRIIVREELGAIVTLDICWFGPPLNGLRRTSRGVANCC